MDRRAVAPVTGKVLEVAIVLLYVGGLTAALYGGVVPDYRGAAGAEVGDRVLAASADRVGAAVPPAGRNVSARLRVELPSRIHNDPYAVRADDGELLLLHPHPAVGGRVPLSLSDRVSVRGSWQSNRSTWLRVTGNDSGIAVVLAS